VASDGENSLLWGSTSGSIATCITWSFPNQILEFDIVFNDSFTWDVNGAAGKMDVQNIATHELGHTLSLLDLYGNADQAKTMYGYSSNGDISKRSLETEDIAGLCYIYPCPHESVIQDKFEFLPWIVR
jgi:predicted Zn-dependent protease